MKDLGQRLLVAKVDNLEQPEDGLAPDLTVDARSADVDEDGKKKGVEAVDNEPPAFRPLLKELQSLLDNRLLRDIARLAGSRCRTRVGG